MKKFNYLLTLFVALTLFVGCDTDSDNLVPAADTNGFIIDVGLKSTGVFLASPDDPLDIDHTTIVALDTQLDIEIDVVLGNASQLEKIQVFKVFNDGPEVLVHESNTLPTNFQMSTLAEYLNGTGVTEDELRIGDEFIFRTKVFKTTGEVYYFSPSMGDFSVVINCGSAIAGAYTTTIGPVANVTLTEIGTGVYEHSALPALSSGGNPIPFELSDICGSIEIDMILFETYLLQGEGIINADGSFVINGYILYNGLTVETGAFFDNSAEVYTYIPN